MTSISDSPNPSGLCMCGCGRPAPIAKKHNRQLGHIKGSPVRFIAGHTQTKRFYMPDPNPSGFCQCGCGRKTPIAKMTRSASGLVKGRHLRFLPGHHCRRNLEERFWEKVDRRGLDDCWPWLGARTDGYGNLEIEGHCVAAHRIAYELTHGPIAEAASRMKGDAYHGPCVLHRCDNPPCCNPNHLFLGTHTDNMRDMVAKGRHVSGFVIHAKAAAA